MSIQQQFVAEVEAFIKASGMTKTTFGRAAARDPSFVFDLENGRSPSANVIDRVRAWMAEHAGEKAN